ncbi:MAG: hypothetical protein V8R82_05225 [Clostridia bacterium]
MKKYTIIGYITLIILIIMMGFIFYKVYANQNKNDNIQEKTFGEIKKLDSNFSNIFNQLNNVKYEQYKISSSEMKEDDKGSSAENTTGGDSSSSSKESSGEETGDSKEKDDNQSKENKKYELKKSGILTQDEQIDWESIKNDIENIYPSLTGFTLDLYQINANKQEITEFNSQYDNVITQIKEEKKEETLDELSKLYEYLPKFADNATQDEKEKVVLNTKNEIFKAYSILDKEEWNKIQEHVQAATQEFTKLLTNIEMQKNQYNINKAYVMINELKNAVNLKDKEIFLIKYKNLLEELKNI